MAFVGTMKISSVLVPLDFNFSKICENTLSILNIVSKFMLLLGIANENFIRFGLAFTIHKLLPKSIKTSTVKGIVFGKESDRYMSSKWRSLTGNS